MRKKEKELEPLFLSLEKIDEIKIELADIEHNQLPTIRKRMATAYEDGDIPENNPFITANEDLQDTLKRRNNLRELLMRAKLFKPHKEKDIVHLGSSIKLTFENGKAIQITLVSSEEAAPAEGKISIESPLGKAVLARYPGEKVEFETPSGMQTVTIQNL